MSFTLFLSQYGQLSFSMEKATMILNWTEDPNDLEDDMLEHDFHSEDSAILCAVIRSVIYKNTEQVEDV